MSRVESPKTYEDLMTWRVSAYGVAKKVGIPPDYYEDFFSKVLFDFFDGDYFKIFDPSKGTFSTFFYAFLFFRAKGFRDKIIKKVIEEPFTIGEEFEEENSFSRIISSSDPGSEVLFEDSDYLSRVLGSVRGIASFSEVRVVSGDKTFSFDRSYYTLLIFILAGFSIKKIAKLYGTSRGVVSGMLLDLSTNQIFLQEAVDEFV